MEEGIFVSKLSKRGRGLSDGCEIIGALPGEKVEAKKIGRRRAVTLNVLNPSPQRVPLRCKHAPACGGCSLQQMDYAAQLQLKEERIRALFPQEGVIFHPIIGMDDPWGYRNKMEFTFNRDYLGLILAGSKGYVFNLEECHLTSDWFAQTVVKVRKWWQESHIPPGILRYLTLRQHKQKMVILQVMDAVARPLLDSFVNLFDKETSVFLRIIQQIKGQPTQYFEMHLSGPTHIEEQLGNFTFKISPTSFFQPNTSQAERLYTRALELLGPSGTLYDLYCGTGTLGLFAAPYCNNVIGIELNPYAIFDARLNAETNSISNIEFIQGDVGKTLENLQPPDSVIVDPPRVGLDKAAINHLLKLGPKKILYISCNPETQAQNIKDLVGYKLTDIQPVDQFPHTVHCENIAILEKE